MKYFITLSVLMGSSFSLSAMTHSPTPLKGAFDLPGELRALCEFAKLGHGPATDRKVVHTPDGNIYVIKTQKLDYVFGPYKDPKGELDLSTSDDLRSPAIVLSALSAFSGQPDIYELSSEVGELTSISPAQQERSYSDLNSKQIDEFLKGFQQDLEDGWDEASEQNYLEMFGEHSSFNKNNKSKSLKL